MTTCSNCKKPQPRLESFVLWFFRKVQESFFRNVLFLNFICKVYFWREGLHFLFSAFPRSISELYVLNFFSDHSPINSSIETCPMNNQVTENQTFVMQCSSIASPSPTYRIYHNQRLIKENRSGYHKICRVKKSHSGNYTCISVNSYGAGKGVSTQLDVQCKSFS